MRSLRFGLWFLAAFIGVAAAMALILLAVAWLASILTGQPWHG